MGKRIITNRYGLPNTLVKAIELDTHVTNGDYSCTTLIDSPQIRILKRDNDYEVDVIDQLYALLGTALHSVLERANISDARKRAFITTAEYIMSEGDELSKIEGFQEKAAQLRNGANWIFGMIPVLFPEIGDRYVFEITISLPFGGKIISCTFDLYDQIDHVLYDYKLCGTFSYMVPESRIKWEKQANIYAYALEKIKGFSVKKIRIVALFRDWTKYKYMQAPTEYPPMQIMEIEINRRANEQIEGLISFHLDKHIRADNGENIECTGEDRWAEADIFAVMADGLKKAKRRFDDRDSADRFVAENQPTSKQKLFVQYRPGGSRRCADYCPVSKLCPQYKRELEYKAQQALVTE